MSAFDFETWAQEHRSKPRPAILPEKQEALLAVCLAELKRRGIDDVDAFLREQEKAPAPKDPQP